MDISLQAYMELNRHHQNDNCEMYLSGRKFQLWAEILDCDDQSLPIPHFLPVFISYFNLLSACLVFTVYILSGTWSPLNHSVEKQCKGQRNN